MNLIKNGNNYYLAKSGNNYYGIQGNYYTIVNGKLIWANPNIYLQNDSTNYINVNYVPKRNTAVIIDFKVDDVRSISSSTRNWICGGEALYNKPGNFYGGFWFQGTAASGSRFWFNTTSLGSGTAGSVSSEEFILHKYRLILAAPYNINYRNSNNNGSSSYLIQIDENSTIKTINNLESNWGELSKSIVLFNRTATLNSSTAFLLGKIYKAEVWEDNNLIKKLVPVPKGLLIGNFIVSSNGMFDIVEQKFYENQGTGEFTIGGIPEDYIIDNEKLIWCNENIYLQSTGTQYINTGFNANQDTRVKMKASTSTIRSNQSFFVGRNAAKVNTFAAWVLKNGSVTIFRNDYNTTQTNTTLNITANTIYNIDFNKNKFYVDDVLYSTNTYSQFQSTYPIILGASTRYTSSDTNYGNFFKGNDYNCEIYDNDILVRYFVPVPKDIVIGSFTVPSNGMFDIVNQQFYPNQGTGTFTYGKDS